MNLRWSTSVFWRFVLPGSMCALIVYLSVQLMWLNIRLAFAVDEVSIFSEMVEKARSGTKANATEYLDYVIFYYPSGTKQISGSALDRLVEDRRQIAIDEIRRILKERNDKRSVP